DVWRPRKLFGILSAADQESPLRQMSCRLDKELLQGSLPVLGIGAEIGQIGAISIIGRSAPMRIRIDTAVKRSDAHRAETLAQLVQRQAAGKAQDKVVVGETGRAKPGRHFARL